MSLTLASDSSWLTVTKDWDELPELVAIWTAADGAGHCYCYCSEPPAASSAVDRYGMCAKRMKVCDWNSTEAVAMRAGFGVRKSLSRWALGYRVPQDTLSLHRSSMQMSLPFSSHLFTSLHIQWETTESFQVQGVQGVQGAQQVSPPVLWRCPGKWPTGQPPIQQ